MGAAMARAGQRRMKEASSERLRDYLAQLPQHARALLVREFERALASGENVAVAGFVLAELRKVAPDQVAASPEQAAPLAQRRPISGEPSDVAFHALRPFLVDQAGALRPGQIRRSMLPHVWAWLGREGAPESVRTFEAALRAGVPETDGAARQADIEAAAAAAIVGALSIANSAERQRALGRITPVEFASDLPAVAIVLRSASALEALSRRLPRAISAFEMSQLASVSGLLNAPGLQSPEVLPFALELVMQRIAAPWQIIRLAVHAASSDEESRVAATPYRVAVPMALGELSRLTALVRDHLKRSQFDMIVDDLRLIHDGIRGLRTELDLRSDSAWGKQLAAIRVDISGALQSEIDGVPSRVRRLLRNRTEREIAAGARLDATEVDDVAAMVALVAVCRTYASELAINEVTLRAFSELQHYVEQTTETLVQSLRSEDRLRPLREAQARAAIRFCALLFGDAYAALMSRAADNALADVRQAAQAG